MASKRLVALFAMLAVALCLGMWQPPPAYAQDSAAVTKLLTKAQDLFDEARYEESIQTTSAVVVNPEASKKQRIQALQLLAYNYIVLDREAEAKGAVRGLLVIDESFELPDSESPRFRDFFKKAKEKWVEDGKPGLPKAGTAVTAKQVKFKHTSPKQVDKGMAVKLTGEIEDPDATVSQVKIYYRKGTDKKFTSTKVKYAMRKFSTDIPSSFVAPPLVEYYFVALDQNGVPVAGMGNVENPLRIAVPEEASVLTSPWLWVPVGVVVVASVVIVAVVASQSGESKVTVNVFE